MIRGFFFVFSRSIFGFRGFKSFRSLVFDCIFGKNGSIHSSFLSAQWNSENGSMKLWKKEGAKKREKSLEISRFLLFSRSDLFWPIMMWCHYKIDPYKGIIQKQSVAFSLSSAGQYLVFVGSNPSDWTMDCFWKLCFSRFRGFGSFWRRDGLIL